MVYDDWTVEPIPKQNRITFCVQSIAFFLFLFCQSVTVTRHCLSFMWVIISFIHVTCEPMNEAQVFFITSNHNISLLGFLDRNPLWHYHLKEQEATAKHLICFSLLFQVILLMLLTAHKWLTNPGIYLSFTRRCKEINNQKIGVWGIFWRL